MIKRILAVALTLALCAGLCPAFAAVETGGTGYLWCYRDGLFISADDGGSYAELPELRQAEERLGLSYGRCMTLTPLPGGGLRVEAEDVWASANKYFSRDYTAAELAERLARARPTPVRVLATNGAVTVGLREVCDTENAVLGGENPYTYATSTYQLLYSTDGVTWSVGEQLEGSGYRCEGWWDGSAFYVGTAPAPLTSKDGVHWEQADGSRSETKPRYASALGPYRFEVVNTEDWQSGYDVYLMNESSVDTGVLLPDVGAAIRAMGIGVGDIQAWYGPDDMVILAVYDYNQGEKFMYSINYPVSSLDWCLENLSRPFRAIEVKASGGEVSLGLVAEGGGTYLREQGQMVRNDGSGWKRVENVPWGAYVRLLPYNGKTFMAVDTAPGELRLYASADGLTWARVDALRPEGMGDEANDYINYAFTWTGTEYVACREAAVSRHGMMGQSGGQWYGGNTSVYFLDEDFRVTGSHDFGRKVEAVGWYDGAYYVQVANSDGGRYGWSYEGEEIKAFDSNLGSKLYRSADGESWEELPELYLTIGDILMYGAAGGCGVTAAQPDGTLHGVAQLDDWRFVLAEDTHWDENDMPYEGVGVYLLKDRAMDWVELPDLHRAIRASYITPGELTARYNADGTVAVAVADRYTPSMRVSISYPADSLNWVKDNLGMLGYRAGTRREQTKPGVADVLLLDLPNGERELLYRAPSTDGQYMWYDSVPWGNSIDLLPFNGNTFLVRDGRDGRFYASDDGVAWRAAEDSWMDDHPPADQRGWTSSWAEYAFAWTGSGYLASYYGYYTNGRFYSWMKDCGRVTFLDEDFRAERFYDFGRQVLAVGYRDGVYYAQVANSEGITGPEYRPEEGSTLYRSTDGVNWEPTDVIQVRDAMRETK